MAERRSEPVAAEEDREVSAESVDFAKSFVHTNPEPSSKPPVGRHSEIEWLRARLAQVEADHLDERLLVNELRAEVSRLQEREELLLELVSLMAEPRDSRRRLQNVVRVDELRHRLGLESREPVNG